MDRCRHDLPIGMCADCDPLNAVKVWISAGGVRFHNSAFCEALARGQRQVEERGGTPDPPREVPLPRAQEEGRTLCETCGTALLLRVPPDLVAQVL